MKYLPSSVSSVNAYVVEHFTEKVIFRAFVDIRVFIFLLEHEPQSNLFEVVEKKSKSLI